ncbi:hypothetical protein LCGC14_2425940, partial [marine sediment metagenome]
MLRSFSPLLWFHKVDKFFDFNLDQSPPTKEEVYGYEFYNKKVADGLLVSATMLRNRAKVEKSLTGTYRLVKKGVIYEDIRDFLSITSIPYSVFADPGTFTYANEFKLPDYLYDTDGLIDYYNDLNFDLAGSVDWPILDKILITRRGKRSSFDLNLKTKEMRRKLTLELASDFIKKCNKRKNLRFVPFGTIQGWSFDTYI